MAEHMKMSEAELNMLLAKYWNLRHQTGESLPFLAPRSSLLLPPSSFLIRSHSQSRLLFGADWDDIVIEVYMETLANKFGIEKADA